MHEFGSNRRVLSNANVKVRRLGEVFAEETDDLVEELLSLEDKL